MVYSQLDWVLNCHAERSEASGISVGFMLCYIWRFFATLRMTNLICSFHNDIYKKVSQVEYIVFADALPKKLASYKIIDVTMPRMYTLVIWIK